MESVSRFVRRSDRKIPSFNCSLSHFRLPRAVGTYPQSAQSAWSIKPDPGIQDAVRRESEERELREREQRERERQRREREDRERQQREKEEKLRKEQQERERERERDRERRERERKDMERREMERERLLQQQRLAESSKLAAANAQRDRSPIRNGNDPDIRIKEEPRKQDEEMLMRTDPRYQSAAAVHAAHTAHLHSYMASRHGSQMLPPPHMARSMMPHSTLGGPPMSHFPPPPGSGWGTPLDPYRDPYRLDPMHQLRYNPIMEAAMRAEEERVKAITVYAAHSAAHLRGKDPSPVPQHHRMPPGGGGGGGNVGGGNHNMKPQQNHMGQMQQGNLPVSVDMHKKEDTTQSR